MEFRRRQDEEEVCVEGELIDAGVLVRSGSLVRQADRPGLLIRFFHGQRFELVVHFFGPGVELHILLRFQEVQDFDLDRPFPAAVQVGFLARFDDADEELAVGVLRDFVDIDLPVRPYASQFPGDRFDKIVQGQARSPSFTLISWWVA